MKQQHASLVNPHSFSPQANSIEETLLWQQYSHKLSSIAGTLSDSYWVSQGLSMLKLEDDQPLQSKTKQALRLLNGHNSKIELINKILKNMSLCSRIQSNQEKLVKQLIKLTNDWEKWKHMRISKLHFHEGLFGNGQNLSHQNQDEFHENIDTFETDFDDKKLKEFEQGYDNEQKDVEI